MNRSLKGLYRSLEPLRLYALHQDSLVDRELSAYGVGFQVLEDLLEEIETQAFVQTAAGELLDRHEKQVGLPPRTGLSDEARRELVLYRMGVAPLDFTPEGLRSSLRACGLEAEIIEKPQDEAIVIRFLAILDETLDLDRLKNLIGAVLPAHLDCELDYGELTWDMLEEGLVSWDEWDAAGFTWTSFDLNGHTLFT